MKEVNCPQCGQPMVEIPSKKKLIKRIGASDFYFRYYKCDICDHEEMVAPGGFDIHGNPSAYGIPKENKNEEELRNGFQINDELE